MLTWSRRPAAIERARVPRDRLCWIEKPRGPPIMAKSHSPTPRKLRKETIRRRAAQVEAERDLLVVAATTIFGERGYHEAAMREIATQAGFSVGALYQRFDSKDALYCEVVEKHFGAIWGVVGGIPEQHLDFRPRMLALTAAIFEHYVVHRSFLRLYLLHPPTVEEPYQSRITQMQSQERARHALVDALCQGQRDGLIAGADAEFLGSMYVGMINRALTDYLTNRRPLPEPEQLLTLFLDGAAMSRQATSPQKPPARRLAADGSLRPPPPRQKRASPRARTANPD